MELSNAQPPDDPRASREIQGRPGTQNARNSQGLIDQGVQQASEMPDDGGVLASSHTESGSIKNATVEQETQDETALAETIRSLSKRFGLSGSTRLAIEVDEETNEARFLILSRETGEVLRTVPSEDILASLRTLSIRQGIVLDQRM